MSLPLITNWAINTFAHTGQVVPLQFGKVVEVIVIVLVIIVLLFLRDLRATIIAAVSLPLSIFPAFWAMDILGFSLNLVSFLAITLSTGILVDDAIVEIENIVRHMRMGKSAYQASIDAADEIGLAVVATTFSIVAVFLPVGFMGGVIGRIFNEFAVANGFTGEQAALLRQLCLQSADAILRGKAAMAGGLPERERCSGSSGHHASTSQNSAPNGEKLVP